jgi:hypothetical protein
VIVRPRPGPRHLAVTGVASVVVSLALGPLAITAGAARPAADTKGVASTPRRPLVTGTLPRGWSVTSRHLQRVHGALADQSLFLGPDATPTSGPALLAGYIGDDEGPPYCYRLSGPGSEPGTPPGVVRRWGRRWSVVRVRSPDFFTANDAYVIGRDVPKSTLSTAARTLRWTSRSTAPELRTPGRFRLSATSGLAFDALPGAASVTFSGPNRSFVLLGQERENAPALRLTRFWRTAERARPRCPGYAATVQRTVIRGHLVYRLSGHDTRTVRAAARAIPAALHPVSRAAFCAAAPSDRPAPDDPSDLCPDG